jgi:hypothetical protein
MNATTSDDCTSTGTEGRYVEVEFGFFVPGSTTARINVRNLTFSIYDLDSTSGSYRDQVTVAINGAAITSPVTLAPASNPQAVATRAVADAISTITQPTGTAVINAKSNASSAASSVNGNIQLAFQPTLNVNSVRVRFADISGDDPTTIQWVGIGDLTFCKFGLA